MRSRFKDELSEHPPGNEPDRLECRGNTYVSIIHTKCGFWKIENFAGEGLAFTSHKSVSRKRLILYLWAGHGAGLKRRCLKLVRDASDLELVNREITIVGNGERFDVWI